MTKRKRTFETVDELRHKIEECFAWCKSKDKPLSIERLSVFLGMSAEELRNYTGGDKYAEVLLKAKDIVLADLAERSINGKGSVNGITLLMKNNFGYKDKKEVENTGRVTHEAFVTGMLEKAKTIDAIDAEGKVV